MLSLVEEGKVRPRTEKAVVDAAKKMASKEVGDLASALRTLSNAADQAALVAWLRSPMIGISDAAGRPFVNV